MKDEDDYFRVNVRFNRVEYSDLDNDLRHYSGHNKGNRIRMLLRLGLQVANGHMPIISRQGEHPHHDTVGGAAPAKKADRSVSHQEPKKVERAVVSNTVPVANASAGTIDALAGMGFDPTQFQYGGIGQ